MPERKKNQACQQRRRAHRALQRDVEQSHQQSLSYNYSEHRSLDWFFPR
jgi:hypothetical protein